MELVDLLRELVEKLEPLVEHGSFGQTFHDPDRNIERLVVQAGRVLDKGLLIGRGV